MYGWDKQMYKILLAKIYEGNATFKLRQACDLCGELDYVYSHCGDTDRNVDHLGME